MMLTRRIPLSAGRPLARLIAVAAVAFAALLSLGALRLARAPIHVASAPTAAPPSIADSGTAYTTSDDVDSTAHAAVHVGFDTNVYPGDKAMDAWRRTGVYEWVGFYLAAPCHSDGSWSGKRATLVNNGWGFAVIYVGQQTWGRSYARAKRVPVVKTKKNGRTTRTYRIKQLTKIPVATNDGSHCDIQFVNAAQGKIDARDAIAEARSEGFPPGTTIFLDVEFMDAVPQRMRDYYRAWTRQVLADGRFKPGMYVHTNNAATVYADVTDEFERAGNWGGPAFWISGTGGFSEYRPPAAVGHEFATAWQGLLDVVREHNGVRLPVDVSVATVASPSGETASVPVAAAATR
jgi:hypothetical protein